MLKRGLLSFRLWQEVTKNLKIGSIDKATEAKHGVSMLNYMPWKCNRFVSIQLIDKRVIILCYQRVKLLLFYCSLYTVHVTIMLKS